jgi:hypothetical protein
MGDFPESGIKICDFELSRIIGKSVEREVLGTPDYVGEFLERALIFHKVRFLKYLDEAFSLERPFFYTIFIDA